MGFHELILKCGVKHERNTFVSGRHLTASGSKPALGRLGRFGAAMDNLERSGWDEVALAGIADLDWEEQKRILRPVTGPMSFGDELQLKARIAGADVRQRLDNTSFARMPVGYFVDTHWARRYGAEAETPLAPLLEWERVKRNAPVTRWPTRFQRTLDGVEDKVFRSELEAKERGKVVRRLADFLAVTGLWRPEESGGSREGAELAQQRFAMGRRLGTLRQHLRNAEKISRFCIASYNRRWMTEPRDFYDLVASRLSEPCGRHVPRALLTSIGFIEQAAEVDEGARLSRNPGVRNFLREVESSAGWKTGRITKKASPYPLMVVLALEDTVMRKEEKSYARWYAWLKLVKLWAALRWDDVQGVPNPALVMRTDGTLVGKITRSKTTGVGKKVEVMNFYISGQAYFLQPEWLLTGWTLNGWMSAQSGMTERDYLAPLANQHLTGFRRAMTKYSDATSMTRALLCRLRVDVRATEKDTDLAGIDPTLVFPEAIGFWSEHSERGTMNTWMQMAGVPPEVRRMVGRWSVSQEEEYLRNLEASVTGAQQKVAQMVQEGPDSSSAFGAFEHQVAGELRRYLELRGVAEETVLKQLEAIALPPSQPVPPSVGVLSSEVWSLEEAASLGFGDSTVKLESSPGPAGSVRPSPTSPAASPTQEEGEAEGEGAPVDGEQGEAPGTFVFSVLGSCNRRTLHRVGECWRRPGVHYRDYLLVGPDRPPLGAGDRECRDCFRRVLSIPEGDKSEAEMSSSSSSEDGPEAAQDDDGR